MKYSPLAAVALLFGSVALPVSSQAETINMIGSNSGTESWAYGPDWSNGAAASAGNVYVVGAGFQVRSPNAQADATFAGDSLTVTGNGASLLLRTNSGGRTVTIATLVISDGAALRNGYSSSTAGQNTQTLNGGVTFLGGTAGYSLVQTGGSGGNQSSMTGPRNFVFNALVSGSGEVRLQDRGAITLNNAANNFAGTWVVGGGSNTIDLITTLNHAAGAGSFLGLNSSVTLALYSDFQLNYDWTTTGALTLVSNGGQAGAVKMNLTNNITVGSLTIAGQSFGVGTYTAAQLSGYADYFNGTTGSITVVPEPGTWALMIAGVTVLVVMRRRRLA